VKELTKKLEESQLALKAQEAKITFITKDFEQKLKDQASEFENVNKVDKQTIQDLNHKLSLKEELKTPPASQDINQF
jgi:hypothetical protein